MNKSIFSYSESLVLSLCKEIEYIKSRTKNINYSLKSCQNKLLSNRLKLELYKLKNKRKIISSISEKLLIKNSNDLSLEFLYEISRRSSSLQQI